MMETENIVETVEFYRDRLGFKCQGLYPDEENPCWASLVKDSVELMFTVKNAHTKVEGAVMTGSLYLYPDDVDQLWESLKYKTKVEYPIENFAYGMREFAIRDNNGYLLQFGQDISD